MATGEDQRKALDERTQGLFDVLCKTFDGWLEDGIKAGRGAPPVAIAEAVHLFAERTFWSLENALEDMKRDQRQRN